MLASRTSALSLAALVGLFGLLQGYTSAPAPRPRDVELVRVEAGELDYRTPGEFLEDGAVVAAPMNLLRVDEPFEIMRRQVTRGDYQRCVAAHACQPLQGRGDPALPVVGVSWDDASRYAAWISRERGETWRLPTDREWALAAGSRYVDDSLTDVSDATDPSKRWIAAYQAESSRQDRIDPTPRPVGAFGANERGILDLAGNVWEWTSTCYTRYRTSRTGGETRSHENCGVRIAEGRHRAYVIDFFRDPKAGACSVGVPPANLGIRLVRETRSPLRIAAAWVGF